MNKAARLKLNKGFKEGLLIFFIGFLWFPVSVTCAYLYELNRDTDFFEPSPGCYENVLRLKGAN